MLVLSTKSQRLMNTILIQGLHQRAPPTLRCPVDRGQALRRLARKLFFLHPQSLQHLIENVMRYTANEEIDGRDISADSENLSILLPAMMSSSENMSMYRGIIFGD